MSRISSVVAKAQKTIEPKDCDETSSDDEDDDSLSTKDETEKAAMRELLTRLPRLGSLFTLHRKVGEGTFSSVYVGSLRGVGGGGGGARRLFAMKHLVGGAHPLRVEHELRCLRDMGGRHHVVPLELCLRHLDTVVIVMPYIPHVKFSEYVGSMGAEELAAYMRALLQALRHVHSFGVIHRDVKPSNFLYDRTRRRYQLIDFGLAQTIVPPPPRAHASTNSLKRPHTDDAEPAAEAEAGGKGGAAACACAGVGGVCAPCAGRGVLRAPRAGTQGFRPPEVLLRSTRQSTAVDVWAAGVVLLCVLCARYPLLRATDDVSALAELGALLGTRALQRAARALGRRLQVSQPRPALCLRKLARRLRTPAPPAAGPPCAACAVSPCLCLRPQEPAPAGAPCGLPEAAFALVQALLQPDPALRPSAAAALAHPFLATA